MHGLFSRISALRQGPRHRFAFMTFTTAHDAQTTNPQMTNLLRHKDPQHPGASVWSLKRTHKSFANGPHGYGNIGICWKSYAQAIAQYVSVLPHNPRLRVSLQCIGQRKTVSEARRVFTGGGHVVVDGTTQSCRPKWIHCVYRARFSDHRHATRSKSRIKV